MLSVLVLDSPSLGSSGYVDTVNSDYGVSLRSLASTVVGHRSGEPCSVDATFGVKSWRVAISSFADSAHDSERS